MRRASLVLLLAHLLPIAGCGALADLTRIGEPRVVAELEVFNRTEEPAYLVGGDEERMDVPPCGQAIDSDFRVDNVQVFGGTGYLFAFGYGGPEASREHLYLVLKSGDTSGFPELGRSPTDLPPCQGRLGN